MTLLIRCYTPECDLPSILHVHGHPLVLFLHLISRYALYIYPTSHVQEGY